MSSAASDESAPLPAASSGELQSSQSSKWLWLLSLLWLVLLVAFQSGLFWLHLPYDLTPDQDIILAYNALVMNAGLPQEYFDHTGYVYFLVITQWFRLLHAIGVLRVDTLTALPLAADPSAFEISWQQIVEAGRLLTMLIIAVFTIALAALVARLLDDRRIGFFAGLAFATSAGTINQIGTMRTEPLSAFFVFIAILLVILAASGKLVSGRFLFLGLAAFSGVLAVLTKVFAFLPLASAPLIAVAFGTTASTPRETGPARRKRASLLLLGAALVSVPAGILIFAGFSESGLSNYPYRPFGGGVLAFYQGLFVLWILACIAAYALFWKVPLEDVLSAVAALIIGTSLGLTVLLARYDIQNVIAATHPVEHMFVFSTWFDRSLGGQATVLGGVLFAKLKDYAWFVITSRFTSPTSDNLFLLELWVVAALIVGSRTRDHRWAVQAGLLLLVSWALQTVFLLRYTEKTYHVYSDSFTIMAAAVVLARFRMVLLTRLGSIAVVAGLILYSSWGLHADLAWSNLGPRDPTDLCVAHDTYLKRIERGPFCP